MRRLHAVVGVVALVLAAAPQGAAARGAAPAAASARQGSYKVREGDTLTRVAGRNGVTVDALARANHIANPDHVLIGQVLTIPRPGQPPAPTPKAPAPKAPAAPVPIVAVSPAPLPPLPSPYLVVGGGRTHRVVAGQTLNAIAGLYGTTVADLVKANGLKDPNLIREGAQLAVPGPPWLCPVQGPHQFTDSWGAPRAGGRRHLGVDMFAARGTPVVASVGGTIRHSFGAVAGNSYYLAGDDANTYYGAHLDTLTPEGRVERGAVLGTVGDTGDAKGTTTHLHFEIKPGGGPSVDPFPTLQKWC